VERVHAIEDRLISEIKFAAVAIGISDPDSPHQFHTGVIHLESSGVFSMLHLEWHQQLVSTDVDRGFLWIEIDVDEDRLRAVAALCRRIARTNHDGRISYGFSSPNGAFDEATGRYLLGPTQTGLTCATFVLAVFEAAKFPLIDLDSWPTADEFDQRWQRWIAGMLKRFTDDSAHADAVLGEVGVARIRPEHVAAAALSTRNPVIRSDIEEDASRIAFTLFDRHREGLLEGHEEYVTSELTCLLDMLFKDYRFVPFSIQFVKNRQSLVRYHHPFQYRHDITIHLDQSSRILRCLLKILPNRLVFEWLTQATHQVPRVETQEAARKQRLQRAIAEFLTEKA